MSDVPDLSTLPQRMRYAADVLREAIARGEHATVLWSCVALDNYADEWEDEDRAGDELVNELAPLLDAICQEALTKDRGYVYVAHRLVEAGWRKGDPA